MHRLVLVLTNLFLAACVSSPSVKKPSPPPPKVRETVRKSSGFPLNRSFTLYDLEGNAFTREGTLKFGCKLAAKTQAPIVSAGLLIGDAGPIRNDPALVSSIAALTQSQPLLAEYLFESHGPQYVRLDETRFSDLSGGGEVVLSQPISRVFGATGSGRAERVLFAANADGDGFEWSADYILENTGRVIGTVTIPLPCEESHK